MEKSEEDLCGFAANIMTRQVEDLERELLGASEEEDIEFVHRSRVASRRLRASLMIFEDCLPPRRLKGWTKAVRNVTRSLGAARDLDVQIDFLRRYINESAGDASLHRMLSALTDQRREAQQGIDAALALLREGSVLEDMRGWCSETSSKDQIDRLVIRRRALTAMLARLDTLFEYERYVDDPSAIKKHHEMRIAGKRLRYTLEIFDPVFDNNLKPYIKRLKEMQDVLGEMHDCDVWIEMLARRKGEGTVRLREDRRTRRAELHGRFVDIWKDMRAIHIPDIETCMRQAAIGYQNVLEITQGPVALISDVHGNLPALLAVMRDADEAGASIILNAGDNVGIGAFNMETLAELEGRGVVSIMGNFDRSMLDLKAGGTLKGQPVTRRAAFKAVVSQLDGKGTEWLATLPERIALTVAGKKLLICHGSPGSPTEKVLPETPEQRMAELASMAHADVVLCGHSHVPLDRESSGVRFINPGSVGVQLHGEVQASYALWDIKEGTVTFRRVPYALHELLDRTSALSWPKNETWLLMTGTFLGDRTEGGRPADHDMRSQVEGVAMRYGQLDEHTRFVSGLALRFFDILAKRLNLDLSDRILLECAAIAHDIGWSWGNKDHNRSSFDLIMMSTGLNLPIQDRLVIANVARYHKGRPPRPSHGNIEFLSRSQLRRVKGLSSLLRIADGLDYGHAQRVELRSVHLTKGKLRIIIGNAEHCQAEIASALKKSDLFEEITDLEVVIE